MERTPLQYECQVVTFFSFFFLNKSVQQHSRERSDHKSRGRPAGTPLRAQQSRNTPSIPVLMAATLTHSKPLLPTQDIWV